MRFNHPLEAKAEQILLELDATPAWKFWRVLHLGYRLFLVQLEFYGIKYPS